jgi:hypothetical protein
LSEELDVDDLGVFHVQHHNALLVVKANLVNVE